MLHSPNSKTVGTPQLEPIMLPRILVPVQRGGWTNKRGLVLGKFQGVVFKTYALHESWYQNPGVYYIPCNASRMLRCGRRLSSWTGDGGWGCSRCSQYICDQSKSVESTHSISNMEDLGY